MAPLKTVVEDERQRSKETGDTHTVNVINELRLIWLQSTYLGLEEMVILRI